MGTPNCSGREGAVVSVAGGAETSGLSPRDAGATAGLGALELLEPSLELSGEQHVNNMCLYAFL